MADVVVQCPRCSARYEIPEADRDKPRACDQCGAPLVAVAEEPPTASAVPGSTTAAEPTQAEGVWQPGQAILDLYEVKQLHDSGGMALVYRVRHRGWDMDLAVKCPRPEALRD